MFLEGARDSLFSSGSQGVNGDSRLPVCELHKGTRAGQPLLRPVHLAQCLVGAEALSL